MEKETLEQLLLKESLHRSSQNNMNQASAGYNAKWFRRGGLFVAKLLQKKLYSEEEVYNIILDLLKKAQVGQIVNYEEVDEWFEKFKKK